MDRSKRIRRPTYEEQRALRTPYLVLRRQANPESGTTFCGRILLI
jgi:hypothetical protein